MRLVKPNPVGPSVLDDLFVEKYEWLMRALYFTQGERATAEDLVHDTFVRFAISHPELDHEKNAEKLLYKYLKYVHQEHLYRLQKYPHQSASVEEFDSLSLGLRQNPALSLMDVQNTLRRILTYLCWRKEAMKAASVLILRFFYGFFPEEIMQIGNLSRTVLDNSLLDARRDLKRHFAESASGRVRSFDEKHPPEFVPAGKASDTDEFITEFRGILYGSRHGDCLSAEDLVALYEAESPKPLETELLAHLVSCRPCLEIAIRTKKLPPLEARSFESALVERHDAKSVSGAGAAKPERNKSVRRSLGIVHDRIEEVLEHHPKSLSVVVNGHVIATQEVNSAISKLEVEIKIGAPIELVEILSDQGLCVLAMSVAAEPPLVSPELYRQVHLRDDRTVEAWLRFTSMGPRVETLYCNPAFAPPEQVTQDQVTRDITNDPRANSLRKRAEMPIDPESKNSEDRDAMSVVENSKRPLPSPIRVVDEAFDESGDKSGDEAGALIPFAATTLFTRNPEAGNAGNGSRISLWSRFRSLLVRITRPSMNPMLATSLALAVASVVFLALWWHQPLNITANALLVRAEAWDTGGQRAPQYGVIRQQVSVKAPGYSVTRVLYRDAQGLRRPKSHKLSWADEALKRRLAASGVDWDQPLSATSYQDWHDRQRVRQDSITRTGAQLIKLTTSVPSGPVREESLTVRISDFHPVERTVEFNDNETVEIAELNYDVLPWSMANPDWFEQPNAGDRIRPHHAAMPPAFHLPPHLTDAELDEAELEVLLVLNRLHLDTGRHIDVRRGDDGIHVLGVVDTSQQKQDAQSQLALIPYVIPVISTVQELSSSTSANSISSVQAQSVVISGPSSIERYLAEARMDRNVALPLTEQVVNEALLVNHESKAISDLWRRFAGHRVSALFLRGPTFLRRYFTTSERRAIQALRAALLFGEDGNRNNRCLSTRRLSYCPLRM